MSCSTGCGLRFSGGARRRRATRKSSKKSRKQTRRVRKH